MLISKNINMKKLNRIKCFIGLMVAIIAFSACNKSFLEKPPLSSVVDANFYKTDDQVLAATSLLYSQVWFDYNDKAMYNLGDFRGGTCYFVWDCRGNGFFNNSGVYGEKWPSSLAFFC